MMSPSNLTHADVTNQNTLTITNPPGGTASYLVPSAAASLLSLAGNIADAKAAWERARGVALAAVPRVRRAGRALLDAAERCGDAGALGR